MITRWKLLLLSVSLLAAALMQTLPQAQAYSFSERYFPPEIAYADDLRQKVTLPGKVNINDASFNQLRILPGFDEELALKVIRMRPFEDVKDFYRLPGLAPKQIDRLIQQVQPKIIFK